MDDPISQIPDDTGMSSRTYWDASIGPGHGRRGTLRSLKTVDALMMIISESDDISKGSVSQLQLVNGVLQLADLRGDPLVLVRDQLPVEMHREREEDDDRRNDDGRRHDRRHFVHPAETHPRQHRHLRQEQEDPDAGRQDPCQLDVPSQSDVRRTLEHGETGFGVVVVLVRRRRGVDVGQNARADEERDQMNRHDEGGTHCKHH